MIEAIVFDWAGTTIDYGCLAPVSSFKKKRLPTLALLSVTPSFGKIWG